jgi:hypothetical protein
MQTRLQQHSLPRYNACILYTTIFLMELEKKKNPLYCRGTCSVPSNVLTIYEKPYLHATQGEEDLERVKGGSYYICVSRVGGKGRGNFEDAEVEPRTVAS